MQREKRPPIDIRELDKKVEKPKPQQGSLSYLSKKVEEEEVEVVVKNGKATKVRKKFRFDFKNVLLVGVSVALSLVLITQLAPSKKFFEQLWNTVYSHQSKIAALETKVGEVSQKIENLIQAQSQYAKLSQLPASPDYESRFRELQGQIITLQKTYSDLLDTVNKMKLVGGN